MAILRIIDTGFLTSARDGNANDGDDIDSLADYIANAGNAITLNCPKISMQGGAQLAIEPNPSSSEAAQSHFNTFDNEVYEVPFLIDCTSTTDRALLQQIRVLHKTTGVKLLYSSDIATTRKMLPEIIGRTDTRFHGHEITAGIPCIVCRVKGIKIDNIAAQALNYNIIGVLTIEEEQVIT